MIVPAALPLPKIRKPWRLGGLAGLLLVAFCRGANPAQAEAPMAASFDPAAHKVLETDRPDGRYLSTRGFAQQVLRDLQQKLKFNPDFTPAQMDAWRVAVRAKLIELMHFPAVGARPPAKLLRTDRRPGYRLEKWELYPEPGSVVTFLVLIPDTASAEHPAPGVLCFPGSGSSKEQLAGEPEVYPNTVSTHWPERNAMALNYVKANLVAVAVDNPGTAELSDLERYSHAPPFDYDAIARIMLETGRSYLSLSAFQKLQVLDWVRHRDYVDRHRIALSGHSLGTEPLMVMGVLDPDIAAFVSNDFVCRTFERAKVMTMPNAQGARPLPNTITHLVPGLWQWFDLPDMLAALAPRPLLVTEGGVTRELQLVQRAYQIAGAEEKFTFHYYTKYAAAATRRDLAKFPEGLSSADYFALANVDAPNHHFKGYLAVPWLTGVFSLHP